jgi:hypothetical protein
MCKYQLKVVIRACQEIKPAGSAKNNFSFVDRGRRSTTVSPAEIGSDLSLCLFSYS